MQFRERRVAIEGQVCQCVAVHFCDLKLSKADDVKHTYAARVRVQLSQLRVAAEIEAIKVICPNVQLFQIRAFFKPANICKFVVSAIEIYQRVIAKRKSRQQIITAVDGHDGRIRGQIRERFKFVI